MTTTPKSKCCNAPMRLDGTTTQSFICSSCKKQCYPQPCICKGCNYEREFKEPWRWHTCGKDEGNPNQYCRCCGENASDCKCSCTKEYKDLNGLPHEMNRLKNNDLRHKIPTGEVCGKLQGNELCRKEQIAMNIVHQIGDALFADVGIRQSTNDQLIMFVVGMLDRYAQEVMDNRDKSRDLNDKIPPRNQQVDF